MARLSSTTDLSQYVGAVVEILQNSMFNSTGVPREGTPSLVTLINNDSNLNAIRNFQNNASNMSLAFSQPLQVRETDRPIGIGSLVKPGIRVNMGDVAEGVFACAIAARFINRGVSSITSSNVKQIIGSLSPLPVMNRKSQMAFYTTTAPNQGVQVRDGIKLTITLGAANMAFLVAGRNLDGYINASLQYANRQAVTTWVNTLYLSLIHI